MFGSQLATPKMMQAVCSDADCLARHAVQICFQGSTTPPKSCSLRRQVWRLVSTAAAREDSALSGHCGACRVALLIAAREFRVISQEPTLGYGNVPLASGRSRPGNRSRCHTVRALPEACESLFERIVA